MLYSGATGPVFALSEEKCTRLPIRLLVGASSLLGLIEFLMTPGGTS